MLKRELYTYSLNETKNIEIENYNINVKEGAIYLPMV